MTHYKENPFSEQKDLDRYQLWETLVRRDSDAFATGQWDQVENDFIENEFEGLHAHGTSDPFQWTLKYPSLDAYKKDWLIESKGFMNMSLVHTSPLELIYKLTTMNRIDIYQNRALCYKQFVANEVLKDGTYFRISCQTLYQVKKVDSIWKITGFIGYLPIGQSIL